MSTEWSNKKINATKFIIVVADPGTGKTFTGDYLQHIWNFGHVDGDQPFKQGHLKEGYETLSSDMTKAFGKYWMKEKDAPKEIWQPYTDELVRLTLEMATVTSSEKQKSSNNNNNDSGGNNKNNVVLSFAMIRREMRDYTKMKLRKAGAVDVTFLFLHCTMDVLLESKWKRTLHFIEAGDLSMEEGAIFTPGLKGEFNYTNFCKFEREFGTSGHCEPPSISDEPYIEIDVSARDRTVLNEIDKTLGLVGKRKRIITMDDVNNVVVAENNDIDYYHNEIEYEVKRINHARDKEWLQGHLKKGCKTLGINDMIKALGKYFHPFN
ncbi:hypothetical protein FRACYDRAFT_252587 [Fragilariopsis cylindrus CCMP1102]|uniref:Uncharacterized protein n=1 Tax=Fragilariopsis cylindrus CCMP1102 TaxID=635003 RepID=A0A1E7EM38_9STRA|nr:hypothetical protein FRACYDRAFT_252587 [Fragilariopsis cylindrus CCMP1102]|eukprot:OEU06955.1 hypothetical protein FRACYDRAFT_252587 [Fragilariopsis cylindrus CCMP1102]